jgi:hypothetical protein
MPNKQHTMHGRDHEHGAADPTLIHYADTDTGSGGGASDQPWCYLAGASVSVTPDANYHLLDYQDGVTASFFTNDPATFTNGFRTVSGTNYYGVTIHTGGMYRVEVDGVWSGLASTATGTAYWTRSDGGPDSSALSFFQGGRVSAIGNDVWDKNHLGPHTTMLEFLNVPGGGALSLDGFGPYDATPVTITLQAKATGPAGTPTVTEQIWITKLGSGYYSNAGTFP